ncbi:hypothetical protein DSM110093_00290 [Sulfitobacter sp. DSM 110093]|nr:hypothetical protein DSM110093_00290 [Sulfitobacter sp. DSM 110093]
MTELFEMDPFSSHWMRLSMALPIGGVQKCFKTEIACISRMRKVRWPEGVKCEDVARQALFRSRSEKIINAVFAAVISLSRRTRTVTGHILLS